MPGRKVIIGSAVAVVILAVGLTTLGSFLRHEPNFYRQAHVSAGKSQHLMAIECLSEFTQMLANRKVKEKWDCNLTEAQLNSFFAEAFADMGESEGLRKLGIEAVQL